MLSRWVTCTGVGTSQVQQGQERMLLATKVPAPFLSIYQVGPAQWVVSAGPGMVCWNSFHFYLVANVPKGVGDIFSFALSLLSGHSPNLLSFPRSVEKGVLALWESIRVFK